MRFINFLVPFIFGLVGILSFAPFSIKFLIFISYSYLIYILISDQKNDLFKIFSAKLLIPIAFILLKPHFLKSDINNFDTDFGLIFPLHFFSNLEKTQSAADTDICCDIIDLVNE